MTYSTLLENEAIKQNYLAILTPARKISSWTNVSGTIYYNDFTLGNVPRVTVDGVDLTLDTSSTPAANKFYYDYDIQRLYVNVSSINTKYVAVYYEMYFATFAAQWYRIPTDSTSRIVYYESSVIRSPSIKATLSNSLWGYLPSYSSNLTLGNPDYEWEKHLYETSFNDKSIALYHWLDDLNVINIKKVMDAKVSNVSYTRGQISLNIADKIDEFDKEFRHETSFYSTSVFTSLDPNFEGRPVRYVYGKGFDVLLVNLDYNASAPSTSNNRIWGVRGGSTNGVSSTVPAAPASTTTRTYLNSVNGFNVDDSVKFSKGAVEYKAITNVNRISNYIEHTALGAACVNGDTVLRPTATVFIEQDGAVYQCMYDRDYTESASNGVVQITLNANAEVNLGINTINPVSDRLSAHVYGKDNNISAIWTGANSTVYESLTNPIVILYDILVNYAKVTNINTTTFGSLATSLSTQEIGIVIPQNNGENFPTYKELLSDIFLSTLIKFFLDDNLNWSLKALQKFSTYDDIISDDEIIDNSARYDFNYNDIISEIIVEYNKYEMRNKSSKITYSSNDAKYLHNISKQQTFFSLLLDLTNNNTIASKLRYALGDRTGTFNLDTKGKYYSNYVGDTIQVELERLPGYTYVEGTARTRNFDIIEYSKNLNNINLVLNDQKGIEDNW